MTAKRNDVKEIVYGANYVISINEASKDFSKLAKSISVNGCDSGFYKKHIYKKRKLTIDEQI